MTGLGPWTESVRPSHDGWTRINGATVMENFETELEGLNTALRVVQGRIDELIGLRHSEILKQTPCFGQRKTRPLAEFFGGLGYRILSFIAKEEQTLEYRTAKLAWEIRTIAIPFMKGFARMPVGEERQFVFEGLSASDKTDFLNLCKAFKSFGWMEYSHTRQQMTYARCAVKGAVPFMTGGWAELVNRFMVLRTLAEFAREHSCSYDVFLNVRLARIEKKIDIPDMELDIVVQLNDRFYVFETKSGFLLGVDKWVDRARMFASTKRARFMTCCTDDAIPIEAFRPFILLPLSTLEERLAKMLAHDLGR